MNETEAQARVTELGMAEDQQMNDIFMNAAPRGRFGEQSMNGLINAFNDVLDAMGIVDPFPPVDDGMSTFPPDLVRGLAMVADAATTAGMPSPVNLDNVKDDTDVDILAGKLAALASNEQFVTAMAESVGGEEEMEEEVVEAPLLGEAPATTTEDNEALFMDRA